MLRIRWICSALVAVAFTSACKRESVSTPEDMGVAGSALEPTLVSGSPYPAPGPAQTDLEVTDCDPLFCDGLVRLNVIGEESCRCRPV
jgi:hypothetical protein